MATVLFSAKESFYKAQYAITQSWLDFKAAIVNVDGDCWSLDVVMPQGALRRMRLPVRGRFVIREQFVVTAIAIEPRHVNP